MKESPILFNTPMVQAILNSSKTQTRRICKHQHWSFSELTDINSNHIFQKKDRNVSSPFGQPGDLLYVRETYTEWPNGEYQYKASTIPGDELGKWKPSLHMPKAAARIWQNITNINVERIADISEEDAIAEGIEKYGPFGEFKGSKHPGSDAMRYRAYSKASRAFEDLWDDIYGTPKAIKKNINGEITTVGYICYPFKTTSEAGRKYTKLDTWNELPLTVIVNPWVWVLKFEVLSTTGKPQIMPTACNPSNC